MEGIPKKSTDIGEDALRVIKGVLDGTTPSKDITKTGTALAMPETVKEVLEKNTVVTPAMERDARVADIKHNLKENEN